MNLFFFFYPASAMCIDQNKRLYSCHAESNSSPNDDGPLSHFSYLFSPSKSKQLPPRLFSSRTNLHQMTRKQEIRDAFFDGILMAAVGAHELALCNLRLQQQMVQIPHHLLISLQLLLRRRLLRQSRKAQLNGVSFTACARNGSRCPTYL